MDVADYDVTLDWADLNINTGDYYLAKLNLGSAPLRAQAVDLPGQDGVRFGREYVGARQVVLEGTIRSSGDAWDARSVLQSAWDDPAIRNRPGTVEALRVQRPGRPAVLLYGRPERFDPDEEDIDVGWVRYTAAFRQSDPIYYAATAKALTLAIATGSVTGIVLGETGLTEPLTTTTPEVRSGFTENEGDASTWPWVTINGPCTNPEVTLLDESGAEVWRLALNTTLAFDQTVTIDSRPQARTVRRGDGANLSGSLSRDSWLSASAMPPGRHEVIYAASDATGTSTCEFRFRDAYLSI